MLKAIWLDIAHLCYYITSDKSTRYLKLAKTVLKKTIIIRNNNKRVSSYQANFTPQWDKYQILIIWTKGSSRTLISTLAKLERYYFPGHVVSSLGLCS